MRDTLPVFLGGNFTSKVEAESKVAKYIRGEKAAEKREGVNGNSITQYFAQKAELNKSYEQKSKGRAYPTERSEQIS